MNSSITPINTFIIPCLNQVDHLIRTVHSYYKYTPHNFRVIVIFNGTNEDFDLAKKALGDKVHIWIKPYRNLGFGKSMNLGIQMATTEYVTIANDDCEVIYDTWWQEVMEIFAENPKIGGYNPHSFINKAASGDRVVQYEIKDEYTPEDIAAMKEVFKAERAYVGTCTFFTICKRQMFEEIGLFDESFGLGSGEDYDLCVRAARKDWLICGGSRVMVNHWWGATKDDMPTDENFISNYNLIAQGNQHMERKWGPHIDEIKRRIADGRLTEEDALNIYNNGWSVSGAGGPVLPFDSNEVSYPNGKFYQRTEL